MCGVCASRRESDDEGRGLLQRVSIVRCSVSDDRREDDDDDDDDDDDSGSSVFETQGGARLEGQRRQQ